MTSMEDARKKRRELRSTLVTAGLYWCLLNWTLANNVGQPPIPSIPQLVVKQYQSMIINTEVVGPVSLKWIFTNYTNCSFPSNAMRDTSC